MMTRIPRVTRFFLALVSGVLLYLSLEVPLLIWFAFVPLFVGIRLVSPWEAAVGGFLLWLVPSLAMAVGIVPFAGGWLLEALIIVVMALIYGLAMGLAAWLWRPRSAVTGLMILPAAVVAAQSVMELPMGRYVNLMAISQADWGPALGLAGLGGHLMVTGLVALLSATVAVAWLKRSHLRFVWAPLTICVVILASSLGYGGWHAEQVRTKLADANLVRVAAVATDLGQHDLGSLSDYEREDRRRDLPTVLGAYGPLVAAAAAEGAQLAVLPEAHVWVNQETRPAWEETVRNWSRLHKIWLVLGYIDTTLNSNRLLITGPDGTVQADYEKQHPVPFLDFPTHERMAPAEAAADWGALSGVICFDREFADLNRQVAARGGILAAPTNDWRQVTEIHARLAPWTAVQSGAALVAATTHGNSVIVDASGRRLAQASSFDGPVVLVADVSVHAEPLPLPARTNWLPPMAWALLGYMTVMKRKRVG